MYVGQYVLRASKLLSRAHKKRFQNFDYMYSVVGTNFPSVNKDDNAFGKLNYLKYIAYMKLSIHSPNFDINN